MRNKLTLGFLIGILLVFSFPLMTGAAQPVTVVFDGNELSFDVDPVLEHGRVLVPLRSIFEAFGARVVWDAGTQTVNVFKGNNEIKLTAHEDVAYRNGKAILLDVPAKAVAGRLLVPLRFVSESFTAAVGWDNVARTVVIDYRKLYYDQAVWHMNAGDLVAARQTAVAAPLVDPFPELDSKIKAGAGLTVYFPEGEAVRYYLEQDRVLTYVEPRGGVFKVVWQAQKALPGEAYTRHAIWKIGTEYGLRPPSEDRLLYFQCEPTVNETVCGLFSKGGTFVGIPPEITSLGVQAPVIKMGEAVDYHYQLETGNDVAAEEWKYQLAGDKGVRVGNPRAFFRPGKYTVFLRVMDTGGNWSETASVSFTVLNEMVMNEMLFKFANPVYGERFDNVEGINFNLLAANQKTTFAQGGAALHVSNGPEGVATPGILYRSEARGNFRFLYHHMNESVEDQYLYVIAENKGGRTVTLQPVKAGVAGPSSDYMSVGQTAALRYLSSGPARPVSIKPGGKLILNGEMRQLKHLEAVTGMHDYETDGVLTLSVMMGPEVTDGAVDCLFALPELARPPRQVRGVFPGGECLVNIQVNGARPEKVTLGLETAGFDTWGSGIDHLAGEMVRNLGNYGMVYRIRISAPAKTAVLLNPRGRMFRGAFVCPNGDVYKIPQTGHFTGLNEAAVLGVVEAGETVEFIYTPPGGSDTPVVIALIPEGSW